MASKIRTIEMMVIIGILLFPLGAMAIIEMPDQANDQVGRSPIISDDGEVLIPPGLSKLVFIHYKKGFGKPPWAVSGKDKQKEPKCYSFLGKGIKWHEEDLPVHYVIGPGMEEYPIRLAIEEWDSHTSSDLLGSLIRDDDASWDYAQPDGRNELVFGNYSQPGVIAVTVTWGYFSGSPGMRRIVEFDILFDTDFNWEDAMDYSRFMDLQNIATHEIGHGLGLADLYEDTCVEETMYGYSNYGETEKRNLNTGDISGIQELYGEVPVP